MYCKATKNIAEKDHDLFFFWCYFVIMSIVFSMNFKVCIKNLVYKVALAEWFAGAFLEFWRSFKVLRESDSSIVIIFAQNLR